MSSGSEPATDASVLLASRPILTSKQSDSLFPGGFYVNVNNADAFLISMIYSKASITFICLIGMLTAFNTLIFSAEVSGTNLLCRFNDYLPIGKELRQIIIPVVYYCRFLEMSVFANIVQLLLCLTGLVFALNRRSNLFLLFYSFLCLMMICGATFLVIIFVLNYESYIVESVKQMLDWVLYNDNSFCQVLEPMLNCRVYSTSINRQLSKNSSSELTQFIPLHSSGDKTTDAIEAVCGSPRRTIFADLSAVSSNTFLPLQSPISSVDCTDYLTSFMMKNGWLAWLIVEHAFVIVAGLAVTAYAILGRRTMANGRSGQPKNGITSSTVASIDPSAAYLVDDETINVPSTPDELVVTMNRNGEKVVLPIAAGLPVLPNTASGRSPRLTMVNENTDVCCNRDK